jgi:hypothetical protein
MFVASGSCRSVATILQRLQSTRASLRFETRLTATRAACASAFEQIERVSVKFDVEMLDRRDVIVVVLPLARVKRRCFVVRSRHQNALATQLFQRQLRV